MAIVASCWGATIGGAVAGGWLYLMMGGQGRLQAWNAASIRKNREKKEEDNENENENENVNVNVNVPVNDAWPLRSSLASRRLFGAWTAVAIPVPSRIWVTNHDARRAHVCLKAYKGTCSCPYSTVCLQYSMGGGSTTFTTLYTMSIVVDWILQPQRIHRHYARK